MPHCPIDTELKDDIHAGIECIHKKARTLVSSGSAGPCCSDNILTIELRQEEMNRCQPLWRRDTPGHCKERPFTLLAEIVDEDPFLGAWRWSRWRILTALLHHHRLLLFGMNATTRLGLRLFFFSNPIAPGLAAFSSHLEGCKCYQTMDHPHPKRSLWSNRSLPMSFGNHRDLSPALPSNQEPQHR